MSPLWRKQVGIALCPERLALVCAGRGILPGAPVRETATVAATPGIPAWQAALETLRTLLAKQSWRGAEATITLSNHFVHYLLVPCDVSVSSQEEQEAYVRHHFRETYDQLADEWALSWSGNLRRESCLAAAAERQLIEGLRAIADHAGMHLKSVQPYLALEYNRWRHVLKDETALFTVGEPGRLSGVFLRAGKWQGAFNQKISGQPEIEWARVLKQNLAAGVGVLNGEITVYMRAPWRTVAGKEREFTLHRLEPSSGAANDWLMTMAGSRQ